MNTTVYECELPDGTLKEYAANMIAENVIYSCDTDGYYSKMMELIVDHRQNGMLC